MLGADVVVQQSLGLFSRKLKDTLGFGAERDLDRGRNAFAEDGPAFDFLECVFQRQVRAGEDAACEPFAFTNQPEQEMLGLNGNAAELAGLVTGAEEYSSSPWGVPFEHRAYLSESGSCRMNPGRPGKDITSHSFRRIVALDVNRRISSERHRQRLDAPAYVRIGVFASGAEGHRFEPCRHNVYGLRATGSHAPVPCLS